MLPVRRGNKEIWTQLLPGVYPFSDRLLLFRGIQMDYKREIQENREYWEAVLGRRVCEKIIKENICEENRYPDIFQEEFSALEDLCEGLFQEEKGWEIYPSEGTFGNFFRFFGRLAVIYAGKSKMIGEDDFRKSILANLYPAAAWIPIRVLIQDIRFCKENGMLRGMDPGEEYRNYQERFLNDRNYIRKLCKRYPEMKRLLFLRIITVTTQMKRIASEMSEDAEALKKQFFSGNPIGRIEKIECGLSDTHHGGQTVAKVFLDHGRVLIYKPRNLEKDRLFMGLYRQFCRKAGLSFRDIRILARKDHSWESYIEQRPCKNEAEVKRYFQRMGILLFLCWLMDMSDMHGENIVAEGEYPMPIDLETLPGNPSYTAYESADEMAAEELRHSVLSVGILPVVTWDGGGKGIILNALNRGEKVKTPFRIPVVKKHESSEIYIDYEQGEAELSGSLPVYRGKKADPSAYAEEICQGFEDAYRYFLQEREQLTERCRHLFSGASRYLIRHTQQYQMYLQTSFYPEFLKDGERRRLFLHVLNKNQKDEELAGQERDALYRMDIPAFYQERAYDEWEEKLKRLGEDDLKKQLGLISLSLGILEKRRFVRRKADISDAICGEKPGEERIENRIEKQIRRIADQVCGMAVITGNVDIGFYGPQVEETGNFRIAPSGIFLYEGIGGITVLLAIVMQEYPSERYRRVYESAVNKLFRYTEKTAAGKQIRESGHTGAFTGEGSVVYTYLLLYEITGEERFLTWAKRHAEIVEGMWETERCMDYLSGLAGAVTVFAKLFRASGEMRYLKTAMKMGERIWERCEAAEGGAGWRLLEGVMPLAGMAHGNSGLILAFSHLLELTRDMRYVSRIKELLAYEDSLYEDGNWKDLRHPEGIRFCNNAWCHGAAGILLSRLKLKQCGVPEFSAWIKRDLERCRQIFLEEEEPEELCLCHGLAGNYLALGIYLQQESDSELEREHGNLRERILRRLEQGNISAREKNNPALMTGLSGIGTALQRHPSK